MVGVGVVGFGLLDAAFGLGSMVGGYVCVRMLGDSSGTRRYSVVLLFAGGSGVVLALMTRLEGALAANLLLGLCITCGDRIPLARLEVLPWAVQCVKCKARGERRR